MIAPRRADCLVAFAALALACRSDQALFEGDPPPVGAGGIGTTPPRAGELAIPCDSSTDTWCPGDDIPGWPRREPDLSALDGKPVMEYELPTQRVDIRFGSDCDSQYHPPCDRVSQPNYINLLLGECDDRSCDHGERTPSWLLILGASDVPSTDSPLGWYDTLDEGDPYPVETRRRLASTFWPPEEAGIIFPPSNWDGYVNAGATVAPGRAFLSEVRPDRIRGIVYFDLTGDVPGWVNDPVVFLLRFDVAFADHAGFQGGANFPSVSGEARYVHYWYAHLTYDEAWPWDSIADPVVRALVYERYTPYLTD